jgi:hypothetical protein
LVLSGNTSSSCQLGAHCQGFVLFHAGTRVARAGRIDCSARGLGNAKRRPIQGRPHYHGTFSSRAGVAKLFSGSYLDRYYDAAWYFTQSDSDNCKREFLSSLGQALENYPQVDLFLLAHGNHFVRWVAELPPERRRRLRLVYNTGCQDFQQGSLWLSLGAKAYGGHPGVSASPVFYFYFLRRWTRGATLQDAMDESNHLMRSALARAQFFSFGHLDAPGISQESEAFSYGDKALRFTGATE